ncbi:MAG: amino acid adenylation domain-containing protein, partial [Bacteroidota bacterium]
MRHLLKTLREQNIYISLEGGRLKLKYDQAELPTDLLQQIKANKSSIINYLREQQSDEEHLMQIAPIPPSEEGYVLSSSQKRMWVLSQFEEASLAYNLPNVLDLSGDFDLDYFKKAIEAVMRRHEILRTVFNWNEAGEVRQWVLDPDELTLVLEEQDFRAVEDQNARLQAYWRQDNQKNFDLRNAPLLRAALLRVTDRDYVFYYNMHHIISDGWSMGVLANDVLTHYEAYVKGEEVPIVPLRIQYKDYAVWQQNYLQTKQCEQDRNFWLNQLSGELPVLDLPSQLKRPKVKAYRGETLVTYLSAEWTERLQHFGQQNGGSLFISLLAIWKVLLHRYTAQKDLLIGSPVAGRDHADLENQIGFYVNTLVLRNPIDPTSSFLDFYQQVKANTLEVFAHQMYPFDHLLEDLDLKRDTSRSALFDVMLVLQNMREQEGEEHREGLQEGGIQSKGPSHAKFDLEIIFEAEGKGFSFKVDYNIEVYEGAMVRGLMRHFLQLVSSILAQPDQRIESINFLLEQEKRHLRQWSEGPKVDYPKDKTIVDLFSEQAIAKADEAAIVCADRQLTYRAVEEWSNRLAHHLIEQHQVQTEDLVGILLPRDEWLLVTMLGILKAGAAYVPLDLAYPESRKNYIQQDANCKVIIDSLAFAAFKKAAESYPSSQLINQVRPEHLMYVIYTSGSTGKPKGVMLEHRNVVAFLSTIAQRLNYEKTTIIAATTNITFDISVLEIFGALCFGKRLVLFGEEEFEPKRFVQKVIAEKVEWLQLTPSRLLQLKSELFAQAIPTWRHLLVGGEAFPESIYQELSNWPDLNAINVYGPTETTIWSTALDLNSSQQLSIGTPLDNEAIYILNEANQLQAQGLIGEIAIAGDGVARGYWNRPLLTEQKFVPHPFDSNQRMYKTGDVGAWLPDGTLQFYGRKDDQVKIRGHRIELGEIVYQLQRMEAVDEVLVLAKDWKGTKELVAYLTSQAELNTSQLRQYLSEHLPHYMVPAFYVQLTEMPMNSSGKIDRQALPNPEGNSLSTGTEYVAPRNEIEAKLIAILTNELGKAEGAIGIHDNF